MNSLGLLGTIALAMPFELQKAKLRRCKTEELKVAEFQSTATTCLSCLGLALKNFSEI